MSQEIDAAEREAREAAGSMPGDYYHNPYAWRAAEQKVKDRIADLAVLARKVEERAVVNEQRYQACHKLHIELLEQNEAAEAQLAEARERILLLETIVHNHGLRDA